MEVIQKYSALETRTSVGVQTRVVMRLQAHIVGELLNVLVKFGLECAHLYQIQPSAQHKCLNRHAHRIVTAQDLPSAVTVDVYDAAHLFLQMKLARNLQCLLVSVNM